MGASQSSTFASTDIVNDVVSSVMSQNITNCTQNTSTSQKINISDITCKGDFNLSGVSQNTELTTNMSCVMDSNNATKLQNDFASKLDNELQSKISGLNIGLNNSEAETYTNLVTEIKTNIDMQNIANCINSALVDQTFDLSKITVGGNCNLHDIQQEIVASQVAKCTQTNTALTDTLNKLDNTVKNKLTASTEGLDFTVLMIISIILLVISSSGAGIYFYMQMNSEV